MPMSIVEKVKSADNLPSLPTVAVQVIQMTQRDDVAVADIARVIEQDPALTVKLLKLVNSPLFGMTRKVSSIQQAMVVLGLRTVKVMVLSFSLVETIQAPAKCDFDYGGYWRRSLTTAVAGRLLAEQVRRPLAEEAFVGGLLCDIGMLAAQVCAPGEYEPVLTAYAEKKGTLQELERAMLGVTHEALTAALLDHWGLPQSLCEAICSHHSAIADPSPSPAGGAPSELVRVLRSASMIADLFCADVQAGYLETCRQRLIVELPMAEPVLNAVLEALDNHVKETASLFSLKIGPTRSYREIQADAVVQLAQLSMAAELERAQIARREQAAREEVAQLNNRNRELSAKAVTDGLTGIGNRTAFEEQLKTVCSQAEAEQQPMGLLMMDLDRFKKLNDTFGHQVGDEALRQVGGLLKRLTTDHCFPARYGGEEFVVVLTECNPHSIRSLAEEIRLGVQQLSIPYGQKRIAITVSIGAIYVETGEPGLTPRSIAQRADQCLYEAKYTGRNRVVFATTRMVAGHASAMAPAGH